MPNIGSIWADINVNTQGLVSGLRRSESAFKSFTTKTSSQLTILRNSFLKAGLVITGIGFGLERAFRFLEKGVFAETRAKAFQNLAKSVGVSGDAIIAKLKEISKNTVDTNSLIAASSKAMLLGIAPNELIRLMEIARAASKATGLTVVDSFERITTGVAKQRAIMLDEVGIVVRAEDAYREYAQALGISTDELSEAQRQIAFTNAVLKAGDDMIRRVGLSTLDTSDKLAIIRTKFREAYDSAVKFFINLVIPSTSVESFNSFTVVIEKVIKMLGEGLKVAINDITYLIKLVASLPSLFKLTTLGALAFGTALGRASFVLIGIESLVKSLPALWALFMEAGAKAVLFIQEKLNWVIDQFNKLGNLVGITVEKIPTIGQETLVAEYQAIADAALKAKEENKAMLDVILSGSKDIEKSLEQLEKDMKKIKLPEASEIPIINPDATKQAIEEIKKDKKKLDKTVEENMSFLEELTRETARDMQNAFEDLFFRTMKNDFENFGDWVKGFWDSILRSISSRLSQWVVGQLDPILDQIFKKIPSAGGGGGGGGIGGFFSGLLGNLGGFFGGLFGGGGGGGQDVVGMLSPNMQHGGIITRPTSVIAGEAGAEAIIPLDKMGDMFGMERPINLTIVMNNPVDPRAFGKTDDEIIEVVAEGYSRNKIIRHVIRGDTRGK